MLLALSGNLASGKTEVTRYLTFQGFQFISFPEGLPYEGLSEEGTREGYPPTSSDPPTSVDQKSLDQKQKEGKERKEDQKSSNANDTLPDTWHFDTFQELLDTVTCQWRRHFVMHIHQSKFLTALQKRPFFLHLSIDAPSNLRYQRYLLKHPESAMSWAQFVARSDEVLYNHKDPLIEINNQAHIKVINTTTSIKSLYVKLSELDLLNPSRLRPTWDSYFMRLADLAALRSNCMKRRVGCVLVKANRVVATGYNGTPRNLTNCNEGGCPRCNQGQGSGAALSTCLCLHAEENALLEAGRDRIEGDLSILYCNTCPCLTCSIKIVQSGIREVVYAQSYSMDEHSHKVMSEAGIVLRQYVHPKDEVFV